MKAIIKNLVLIIIAIFIFSSCSNNKKKDKNVIKIGAILPLTGNLSNLGVAQKNAIQLAEKYFNNRYNIKINIKFADNKGAAKESVTALNKMINVDKIKYFLAFPTAANEAIKPIVEKNDCLLFALSFYPPLVNNTNNVLRIFYNADSEARILSDYIKKKNISNIKISIIRSTDAVTEYETKQFLLPRLMKLTQNVNDIPFNVGQKNFKTAILKVKLNKPDVIIILGFGSDFPNILNEINMNYPDQSPEIIGGIGFLEAMGIIKNKNILDGIKFVAPSFLFDSSNIGYKNISKEYLEKYKTPITYDGIYAIDNIGILTKALNSNRDFSPQEIRDFIISSKTFNGIVGKIKILQNGDSYVPQTLVKYTKLKNSIENVKY